MLYNCTESQQQQRDICCRPEKHAKERDHLRTFYSALEVPVYKMGSFLLKRSETFQDTKSVELYCKTKKPKTTDKSKPKKTPNK